MRRGYTVVELTLVLAIIGLLLGIALPGLTPLRDGWSAEQAAQAVILAHGRARVAAILSSRPLVLTVAPDSLRIATLADSVVWRGPGPAASGAGAGAAISSPAPWRSPAGPPATGPGRRPGRASR